MGADPGAASLPYVAMAILWLWIVDGLRPSAWDLVGAAVAVLGMSIIMFAPRDTG